MVSKTDIIKLKPPQIELIDKKNEITKGRKKISKSCVGILIILIILLFLETIWLFIRLN
jgi:hypothetical protein